MLNQFIKQTFAAAGTIGGTISAANNGIIVTKSITWNALDYLTVRVKGGPQVVTIVPRLPAILLAEYSNQRAGQDRQLQTYINSVTATDPLAWSFAVPFGCLHPNLHGEEIEVLWEAADASKISIASYFDAEGPEVMYQYDMSGQMSTAYNGVIEAYLYRSTAMVAPFDEVLTVQMRDDRASGIIEAPEMCGYSLSRGALELFTSGINLAKVYQSPDDVPGPFWYQMTGSSASSYQIFIVSRIYEEKKVSVARKAVRNEVMRKMEMGAPSQVAGVKAAVQAAD